MSHCTANIHNLIILFGPAKRGLNCGLGVGCRVSVLTPMTDA